MARFFRRGKSRIWFLPAVAAYASGSGPTRGEITSGTELTNSVQAIAGFSLTNAPIAVPDLGAVFTKSIPGEDTTAASTLTIYDDDASQPIRAVCTKGTSGYILLEPYGDVATKRSEVWPVTITGANDTWDVGNTAGHFVLSFAITGVPLQTAIIPA
jgi:hypothetical protein